jgi:hypothetical protein
MAMSRFQPPTSDEIEELMRNAQLRDELEPYCDESFELLNNHRLSTRDENEFLASMLAWERAPILPISKWFEPEMTLPRPESLSEPELHCILWETLNRLYDKRVVLDFTDHLSDRQLYCLILRDILPSHEKKVEVPRNYLHWHCLDDSNDPEIWLRYYATREERAAWSLETGLPLPPSETPPYPRRMPRRPQ